MDSSAPPPSQRPVRTSATRCRELLKSQYIYWDEDVFIETFINGNHENESDKALSGVLTRGYGHPNRQTLALSAPAAPVDSKKSLRDAVPSSPTVAKKRAIVATSEAESGYKDRIEQLQPCFRHVARILGEFPPGDICHQEFLDPTVLPDITVEGVLDTLRFPLEDEQAEELMSSARRIPDSVSRGEPYSEKAPPTWKFAAQGGNFSVSSDDWHLRLKAMTEAAATALGVRVPLRAELCEMMFWHPNSFWRDFTP